MYIVPELCRHVCRIVRGTQREYQNSACRHLLTRLNESPTTPNAKENAVNIIHSDIRLGESLNCTITQQA